MFTVPRARSMTAAVGLAIGVVYMLALVWNTLLLRVMQQLHLNDLGKFCYDARASAHAPNVRGGR